MGRAVLFVICLLEGLAFATTPEQSAWRAGLKKLTQLALTASTEATGIYVNDCQNDGIWTLPKTDKAQADIVWLTAKDMTDALDGYVHTNNFSNTLRSVCFYFAHTHNLKTIHQFLSDPDKKQEVFEKNRQVNPQGRFTLSPSRTDVHSIFDIKKIVTKRALQLGVVIQKTVGIVAGPSGYYSYRPLEDITKHEDLFPEIDFSFSFEGLDNEAQTEWTKNLSKKFFTKKVAWTTLLNISQASILDLKKTDTFRDLKIVYATQGLSVFLDYTSLFDGDSLLFTPVNRSSRSLSYCDLK